MPAYRIKVSIRGCQPPCTRTLAIPEDFSFGDLARAIKDAFDWSDFHLHKFAPPKGRFSISDSDPGYGEWVHESVPISYYAAYKWVFVYDFGDWWVHDLRFLKPDETYDLPWPTLVAAKGASPPEDCGGVYGYALMMEVMEDPDDPEYEDVSEWLGDYDFSDPGENFVPYEMTYIVHDPNDRRYEAQLDFDDGDEDD